MFSFLLILALLVVALAVFPSLRTYVFTKLGIQSPTLQTLLNDLESKIDALFTHTSVATQAAAFHQQQAEKHSDEAARASRVAQKLQELVG